VPPAIDALILSLLAKDPAHRMQSCAALVRALEGAASTAVISLGAAQSVPPNQSAMPSTTLGRAASMMEAPTKTLAPTKRSARRGLVIGVIGAIAIVTAVAIFIASGTHSTTEARITPSIDASFARATVGDASPAAQPVFDASAAPITAVNASQPTAPHGDDDRIARARLLEDEGKTYLFSAPMNSKKAADDFRKAIALNPTAQEYLDLAIVEDESGHFDEATEAANRVSSYRPTKVQLENVKQLEANLEKDKRLLAGKPADAPNGDPVAVAAALNEEGKRSLLQEPPDYPKALELFERSNQTNPTPVVQFNIALTQYQLHRCPDARKVLEALIASDKASPKVLKLANDLLARTAGCS
jgi:tetratricopeptide (TPR) repeat protein